MLINEDKDPRLKEALGLAKISAIGIELASLVVTGVLLGRYLDHRFGTSPWLTILGLIFGAIAGFYNLYKVTTEVEDEERRRNEPRNS